MGNEGLIGTAFAGYILITFLIGFIAFQRTKSFSDYVLGGRRLGVWVTALSAGASDMSGWLLLGLPGYAYAAGFEACWIALGLLIGAYLNWRLVAARLRTYSAMAADSLTLPEFFEERFRDRSHLLRIISALIILLFFLFYTSSGLVAGGKLFNSVFGLSYHWAVILGAGAIMIYTFMGGFLAVSWTDLLQGCLMALALLFVPILVLVQDGRLETPLSNAEQFNPALIDWLSDANGEPLTWLAIMSLLGWGLGYFGQPHILARFKAIKTIEDIPRARRIAISWVIVCLCGALAVGMIGIGMINPPLTGSDTEKIFMVLVRTAFHPVLAGICLAAILAAIMSTADSQVLVAASAFTEDIYRAMFKKQASQLELIWVSRSAVIVVALIALVLAWNPDRKVLDLVAYAWAGFGAAFGPALLLSLYWKRMNRYGAFAAMLAGGATVIVWKQLDGGLFEVYELVPGFLFSWLVGMLVSGLTAPPSDEIVREFERVNEAVRTNSVA